MFSPSSDSQQEKLHSGKKQSVFEEKEHHTCFSGEYISVTNIYMHVLCAQSLVET